MCCSNHAAPLSQLLEHLRQRNRSGAHVGMAAALAVQALVSWHRSPVGLWMLPSIASPCSVGLIA